MSYELKNPKIEYFKLRDVNYLKFIFSGKLTLQRATEAIQIWQQYFEQFSDEKITFIWECTEMQGYEKGARESWQRALKSMKAKIGGIWVVTNSSVIRMGASLMALFSEYPIKIVNSTEELNEILKEKTEQKV